ncbi:MAG: ATP-binding protein [Planctomycetota bacterium]
MRDFQVSSEGAGSGLASVLAGLTQVLSDADRGLDATLQTILQLGCERLRLDFGVVARVYGQTYEIRSIHSNSNTAIKAGLSLTLGQTYCDKTIQDGKTFSVSHAAHSPLATHPAYQAQGYESYIGTPVRVNGEVWGTLSFASRNTLGRGFDPQDSDIVELFAAILGSELERDALKKQSADIKHLQRAEDELRSMNVRFSAFMRHSPAIKWAVDSDGCYVFINPAFEQMMGVKPEQCVGRKPIDVLPPQAGRVLDSVSQPSPADLESGQAQTIHVELPIGGRVLPLMVTRFTYTDVKGETFIGGSAVDLSDVADAQRELAERNKDLKSLLYVISHDLREPLRAIRNFSGLVVEREREQLQDSSKDMLGRVVRGAERLDQLLADVLTLSRAQRAEPANGNVSSEKIVKEVLSDLQATIDHCRAEIDVQPGLPELQVDVFWLRQAVHNLVTNALKFTLPDESPAVTIRAFDQASSATDNSGDSNPSRNMVGLVIEDRGPGVEDHQRERIFGLFQRGVSRDVPGTGAGLAIVAEVAERYGGRVWVEAREGGGARFILAF